VRPRSRLRPDAMRPRPIKFINTKKSHQVWQSQRCQCTIEKLTSIEYYKASNNFLSGKNVT